MDEKIIELRVHTEPIGALKDAPKKPLLDKGGDSRWPASALLIDCETTIDARQSLTFGGYQYCRWRRGRYEPVERGIFYDESVSVDGLTLLNEYARVHSLVLYPRGVFLKRVFWRTVRAQALIVCFNAPFDLSRFANDGVWTPRRGGGWSLTFGQHRDRETGAMREDRFKPRLIITPKDGKGAFFRLTKAGKPKGFHAPEPLTAIRVLDLKTLSWALESRSHGLQSACEARGLQGKLDHKPTGLITTEELDYNAGDLRASVGLLNALRMDFDTHPLDGLWPDHTYSPATFAKAYLRQFSVTPPMEKFNLPPELLGIAMESYYGGRAECRIRHTAVPVVYTDFLSQYPTVNTLLGLWRFLIAERLEMHDATEDVRRLLASVTLETALTQPFWKHLTFFALVQPDGDVLPVRTTYNDATSNIGINPLTSETPVWYAGPDLVAATLRSGKPPKVLRAIRIVPAGLQAGLSTVRLRGAIEIDPRTEDFFKGVIEARARVKRDQRLTVAERKALSLFLKILANAGSYGLFVEVYPERVGNDPKTGKPKREKVRVWRGDQSFDTTSDVVERPGPWYCPPLASLITAGGRLLLGTLERFVTDAGGSYLMCDTDSMAIVASQHGGLIPCVGGPHRLGDGREAVKALSWAEVNRIAARVDALNPYDREAVRENVLKVEDVNFDAKGQGREVHGYAIAAKRYALFMRHADGEIQIVKASGHGLGYLYRPKDGFNKALEEHEWVIEAWDWVIRQALGLQCAEPSWFSLPATMRIAITTPEVLKALQQRQRDLPYFDRVKPFNFVLCALLDPFGGYPQGGQPGEFTLIAPFTSDASRWYGLDWVNLYENGSRIYRLARDLQRRSSDAEPKTYRDIVSEYRWHQESKSLASNGQQCEEKTRGVLQRMPVLAAQEFRWIGKETDRRWEREDDISLLNPRLVEYRPKESARLIADPVLRCDVRQYSIRAMASAARVTPKAVKAVRRGERIRKSTVRKLRRALEVLMFKTK